MPMIYSGDTYGCSQCGSDRCGEFRCYTYPTVGEAKRAYREDLRREAANRRGRYEPRYRVVVTWLEGNCSEGVWYGDPTEHRLFYSWERARRYAQDLDYGEPEMKISIYDLELREDPGTSWDRPADVTRTKNPASSWPRYHDPLLDPCPF